jgi:predicted transposase YdaD
MSNAIEDFVVELLLRGRAEGREEGREEGQVEGLQAALLAILTSRFGPVPADVAPRIKEAANVEQLRTLVTVAATVDSFDAFARHLPWNGSA